jgi:hypothetical protein
MKTYCNSNTWVKSYSILNFSNTINYMTSILFACVWRNRERLPINGSRGLVGLVFLPLSTFVTRDIKFPILIVRWSLQFIAAALLRRVLDFTMKINWGYEDTPEIFFQPLTVQTNMPFVLGCFPSCCGTHNSFDRTIVVSSVLDLMFVSRRLRDVLRCFFRHHRSAPLLILLWLYCVWNLSLQIVLCYILEVLIFDDQNSNHVLKLSHQHCHCESCE